MDKVAFGIIASLKVSTRRHLLRRVPIGVIWRWSIHIRWGLLGLREVLILLVGTKVRIWIIVPHIGLGTASKRLALSLLIGCCWHAIIRLHLLMCLMDRLSVLILLSRRRVNVLLLKLGRLIYRLSWLHLIGLLKLKKLSKHLNLLVWRQTVGGVARTSTALSLVHGTQELLEKLLLLQIRLGSERIS